MILYTGSASYNLVLEIHSHSYYAFFLSQKIVTFVKLCGFALHIRTQKLSDGGRECCNEILKLAPPQFQIRSWSVTSLESRRAPPRIQLMPISIGLNNQIQDMKTWKSSISGPKPLKLVSRPSCHFVLATSAKCGAPSILGVVVCSTLTDWIVVCELHNVGGSLDTV